MFEKLTEFIEFFKSMNFTELLMNFTEFFNLAANYYVFINVIDDNLFICIYPLLFYIITKIHNTIDCITIGIGIPSVSAVVCVFILFITTLNSLSVRLS